MIGIKPTPGDPLFNFKLGAIRVGAILSEHIKDVYKKGIFIMKSITFLAQL